MALQPGKGKVEGKHYLPSTPETVRWGELPTGRSRPVLTVDAGATVTFDTVSQEGILDDQGRDPDAFFGRYGVPPAEVLEDARAIAASGMRHRFGVDGPHVVTGPVHVRGAEPGDVLRVDIVSMLPRARYGVISNRHGHGLLAGEFPEGPPPDDDADSRHWHGFRTVSSFCAVERRRGKLFGALDASTIGGARVRFPLSPFMGIMAVAVDTGTESALDSGSDGLGDGEGEGEGATVAVPSTSVGLHGGALDCRDLGVGARFYLPVQVPGALFAVGDPHYAAGDGKIGLTALEGPLRATFRLTALREPAARAALGALREPFVETETCWLALGLDVDVTEAVRRAARSAVLFLSSRLGLERAAALAYLTAAADFGISQLVNGVHTAYCRLRRADFSETPPRPRLPRAALGRLVSSGDEENEGFDLDAAIDADAGDARDTISRHGGGRGRPSGGAPARPGTTGASLTEPLAPEGDVDPAPSDPPDGVEVPEVDADSNAGHLARAPVAGAHAPNVARKKSAEERDPAPADEQPDEQAEPTKPGKAVPRRPEPAMAEPADAEAKVKEAKVKEAEVEEARGNAKEARAKEARAKEVRAKVAEEAKVKEAGAKVAEEAKVSEAEKARVEAAKEDVPAVAVGREGPAAPGPPVRSRRGPREPGVARAPSPAAGVARQRSRADEAHPVVSPAKGVTAQPALDHAEAEAAGGLQPAREPAGRGGAKGAPLPAADSPSTAGR